MLQSLDTLIAFVVIMTIVSLFVTIIVQMASAALSLRGKNLANALALTFQTIDPSLADKAHALAAHILSDPLLSDSTIPDKTRTGTTPVTNTGPWNTWKPFGDALHLANAVRPEEVYAALKKLAAQNPANVPLATQAGALLTALGVAPAQAQAGQDALAAIGNLAGLLPQNLLPNFNTAIGDAARHVTSLIDTDKKKFEDWFSSAQDRAQQWFALHTRAITIGASFVIALAFQLDAVEVFTYASTPSAGRTALIASADNVIKEVDTIVKDKDDLIARINKGWTTPAVSLSDEQLKGITNTIQLAEKLKSEPTTKEKFKQPDFDAAVTKIAGDYTKEKKDQAVKLKKDLTDSGFELIPTAGSRWPATDSYCAHLPGMILFAGLLSLGAPYWYNILKNLTSLKPALSQLIGAEDTAKAEAKK